MLQPTASRIAITTLTRLRVHNVVVISSHRLGSGGIDLVLGERLYVSRLERLWLLLFLRERLSFVVLLGGQLSSDLRHDRIVQVLLMLVEMA